MTAPAVPKCGHCGEQPETRHVHPRIPGARPVTLHLCGCDWPRCGACKHAIRDVKPASRCPHCGGNAFAKTGTT